MKMHHNVTAISQFFYISKLQTNSRRNSNQIVSCRVSVVLLVKVVLLVLPVPLEAVVHLAHQALMVTRYVLVSYSCYCLTVELLMRAVKSLPYSA